MIIILYDITIRYKSTGYMYRWELYFKVEAFDLLTGITAKVDDHRNPDTAVRAAVDKVMEKITLGSNNSMTPYFKIY